jgi:ADP-ribosylglycohydrolase
LAANVGFTTHVDPRGTVSCCIEVVLVRGLLRGDILDEEDVDACIERSYEIVRANNDFMDPGGEGPSEEELDALLDREKFDRHMYAESLDDLQLDSPKAIGFVYKCLGTVFLLLRLAMRKRSLSLYASPLAAESLFDDLIVDLIMERGDADTNGAAACALLGAYLGYANLQSPWTLGLAHKEWLIAKTYRLAVASGVIGDALEPEDDKALNGGRELSGAAEWGEGSPSSEAELIGPEED